MIGPIASWTRKRTYLYVKGTKANQETADVPVTPFLQVSGLLSVKATLQHRYLNMVQDLRGR